ncbi:uncharacterized protein BX663DRAFT_551197 [Cokeromyces recurvatus]|uniref:uncharacterized protein n=1 Tax=Cokeromyces recurvatus TaxID=90255 RepID=UPI00221E69A2|nr:uncharacterized protein BX663DRAFT_551197 [Cokeromyces recurvatus]KAI7903464.1 hypothetical protein BX663DRAFT_551197 [Cokeromyces recurvatus]
MAGHYVIAGKKFLITSSYAALGAWAMLKPKAPQPATPPIQASSTDEEAFIREFLQKAEAEEKKN